MHTPPKPKSPVLAMILGFLLPGAGHLYCGKTKEGAMIFGFAVVVGLLFGFLDAPEMLVRGGSIGLAVASAMGARALAQANNAVATPSAAGASRA